MSKLLKESTIEKLIDLGFIEKNDGEHKDFIFITDKFKLQVDPWHDVFLSILNYPKSIKIEINDLMDLREAIDFIKY